MSLEVDRVGEGDKDREEAAFVSDINLCYLANLGKGGILPDL